MKLPLRRSGFTLIELLIVVAIIGVMMAGALLSLDSGRDIARLKEASRGVAQMAHYANALALLRQRPVVVTYTQKTGEGGAPIACIDVRLSGESMAVAGSAQPAEPIYREVDGLDTSAAGVQATLEEAAEGGSEDGKSVAERAGVFFTRQILDPDELAKEDASRVFEGISLELELLGEDGAVVDERTAALLKDQAEGILNNRKTAIAAWSNTRGEIDTGKAEDEKDGAGSLEDQSPDHVIFETNGNCQPHRVILRLAGEDAKSDGLPITVTRSGKVIIGEPEDE
jgi:prepilin-type N-terminal cleavage/methylation domain-containing protein